MFLSFLFFFFFFTSNNALSSACSFILTCVIILLMRTCSPLTCLWLYYGGTGDFFILNLTFFLGSVLIFIFSLF